MKQDLQFMKKKCAQQKPLYEQFQKVSSFIREGTKEFESFYTEEPPIFGTGTYDLTKLKTMDQIDNSPQQWQAQFAPSVFKFSPSTGRFAEKKLWFIQTIHRNDQKDDRHDALKATIKTYIEIIKPDLVIIEHIPTNQGFLPVHVLPETTNKVIDDEDEYAYFVANKHNIPCIGGEPSPYSLIEKLLQLNVPVETVFVRHFLISNMTQKCKSAEFPIRQYNPTHQAIYKNKTMLFLFEKKIDTKIDRNKPITPFFLAHFPSAYNQAVYHRDCHTAPVILDALKKYNNVFIVYGGSHLATQWEVLVENLGEPENLGTWNNNPEDAATYKKIMNIYK